jgi:hypothetical protein
MKTNTILVGGGAAASMCAEVLGLLRMVLGMR